MGVGTTQACVDAACEGVDVSMVIMVLGVILVGLIRFVGWVTSYVTS